MKRYAFTMLEAVFVIVVIAILAVLAIPNFGRDLLAEATEQLAGHIRYTQHLAMADDRFDPNNPQWYSENWILWVRSVSDVNNNSEQEWYYEVFSDRAPYNANSTIDEEAIDPLTGETLGNGSIDNTLDDHKLINLTRKYGITNIAFSGGANLGNPGVTRISFDSKGRPYRDACPNPPAIDNWRDYKLTSDLNISLTGAGGRVATIIVRPETGYVTTVIP